MHPNLHPNPIMQRLKESNPTARRVIPKSSFYKPDKLVKQLYIAWETGRKRSFHYRDYMGCDLSENEPDTLILFFVGATATLKGHNLDRLASRLRYHEPETIAVTPSRYTALVDLDQFVIIEAIVEN